MLSFVTVLFPFTLVALNAAQNTFTTVVHSPEGYFLALKIIVKIIGPLLNEWLQAMKKKTLLTVKEYKFFVSCNSLGHYFPELHIVLF